MLIKDDDAAGLPARGPHPPALPPSAPPVDAALPPRALSAPPVDGGGGFEALRGGSGLGARGLDAKIICWRGCIRAAASTSLIGIFFDHAPHCRL